MFSLRPVSRGNFHTLSPQLGPCVSLLFFFQKGEARVHRSWVPTIVVKWGEISPIYK